MENACHTIFVQFLRQACRIKKRVIRIMQKNYWKSLSSTLTFSLSTMPFLMSLFDNTYFKFQLKLRLILSTSVCLIIWHWICLAFTLSIEHGPLELLEKHGPLMLSEEHGPLELWEKHRPLTLWEEHRPLKLWEKHGPLNL